MVVGQLDHFNSGGTPAWRIGGSADTQPSIVPSGGITGSSDGYLQTGTSGTHNVQSRLIIFNSGNRWLGDYGAAGVLALEVYMKNFGDTFGSPITLQMRLAVKESTAQDAPGYTSLNAFLVPSDGQWHKGVFYLSASDLVAIGSPTKSLAQLLANPGEVRLLHSDMPSLRGSLVEGFVTVGFDNIRAIPEPATAVLLLGGAAALTLRRRQRRR